MRREQDGEENTVISKTGTAYKKKILFYIYSGLCGIFGGFFVFYLFWVFVFYLFCFFCFTFSVKGKRHFYELRKIY